MSFSEEQISKAIEQGIRHPSALNNLKVVRIQCEDMSVYGLSANTFQRCRATVTADKKEQVVDLIIKKWVPGGITDIDMGIDPQPRESMAFKTGIFAPGTMPVPIDAPFIAALNDPPANDYRVILRDVSDDLAAFRTQSELSEIYRKYSIALDNIALMHAAWEKPDLQARLKKLNWLVPDSVRLSRGELVARYLEGFSLDGSEPAKIDSIKGWINGARIQQAREAFYKTLSKDDAAMWKRHETDRTALIAEFGKFPTTLVHGDFWPLNIGLPIANGEEKMRLIDWEWMGNGCSSLDVAKLLSVGAANEYADFDGQKLAAHYFDRYLAHGGSMLDSTAWQRAYKLAEVYHALIVHTLAAGWSILDNANHRAWLEAKTPRLVRLIAEHLG
jgi:hypothetical protein